jgi:hypothetical protein
MLHCSKKEVKKLKNLIICIFTVFSMFFSLATFADDLDDDNSTPIIRGLIYNIGSDLVGFVGVYWDLIDMRSDDDEEDDMDDENHAQFEDD